MKGDGPVKTGTSYRPGPGSVRGSGSSVEIRLHQVERCFQSLKRYVDLRCGLDRCAGLALEDRSRKVSQQREKRDFCIERGEKHRR